MDDEERFPAEGEGDGAGGEVLRRHLLRVLHRVFSVLEQPTAREGGWKRGAACPELTQWPTLQIGDPSPGVRQRAIQVTHFGVTWFAGRDDQPTSRPGDPNFGSPQPTE